MPRLEDISDSLEVRWFLSGEAAPLRTLQHWFAQVPSQPARIDHYLRTGRPDLGVKLRTSESQPTRVETKFLVASLGARPLARGVWGDLQGWRKLSLEVREEPREPEGEWLALRKQRRLRTYALEGSRAVETAAAGPRPHFGCAIELTKIELPGQRRAPAFTLGLEAFGEEQARHEALRATFAALRGSGFDAPLSLDDSMGYARWVCALTELERKPTGAPPCLRSQRPLR